MTDPIDTSRTRRMRKRFPLLGKRENSESHMEDNGVCEDGVNGSHGGREAMGPVTVSVRLQVHGHTQSSRSRQVYHHL